MHDDLLCTHDGNSVKLSLTKVPEKSDLCETGYHLDQEVVDARQFILKYLRLTHLSWSQGLVSKPC